MDSNLNQLLEKQRERAKEMDNGCFQRAQTRKQQTFTLVEQDQTAPQTILAWINLNWKTAPAELLYDAFMDALAMRESTIKKKFPGY